MLGQLGAPVGFIIAAGMFSYMLTELSQDDFLVWGWRYPFYVAFAINVVALFARLRLVSTPNTPTCSTSTSSTPPRRAKWSASRAATSCSAPSPPWPATRCSTW
jgi:MFS family permease